MTKKRRARTTVALTAGILLVMGRASGAQDVERRAISLDEALQAALALPDLKAAEAALRVAEAGIRLAGRWPDPSFSFATRSITAKESYAFSVPLPWPGRGARLAVARAEAAVVGTDKEAARLIGRRAMRLAWFTLAAREDLESAATERMLRMKRTSEAVTALYDAGRVALVESSRARADAALAVADASLTEQEERIAESVLRRLMSIESGQRLRVVRPLPVFPSDPPPDDRDLEQSIAIALVRSPAARAAEARLKAAEASLRLAQALRFPGLAVDVGADRNDPTQPGTDRSIGVSLTVPLSAGPGVLVAKAERDRATALRDQTKREIADQVEQAWRTVKASGVRYQSLTAEGLPAALQAADLAQLAYREGRSDIFRVLDAERTLAETRATVAEAYLAWGVAQSELLAAVGEEER